MRRNSLSTNVWYQQEGARLVPKPSDYPVGSVESRAAARAVVHATTQRVQLLSSCDSEALNLETSYCERMLWPKGLLVELIFLDGRSSDLSEDELEAFISRFPIRDDR